MNEIRTTKTTIFDENSVTDFTDDTLINDSNKLNIKGFNLYSLMTFINY